MLNEIIHQGNSFAETWAWWVATSILNATLVLTVVSLLWFAIRRKASPQLGYLLFLLVPLKLFVPLEIAVPARIGSWMPIYVPEAAKRLELTSLAEQTTQRTGESVAMIVGEQSTPTVVPSDASLPGAPPEVHLPAASRVAPDHRSAAPALTSQLPSHPSVDPHSNKLVVDHKATTDASSHFLFDRVVPGRGRIGRSITVMVRTGPTEVTSAHQRTRLIQVHGAAHAERSLHRNDGHRNNHALGHETVGFVPRNRVLHLGWLRPGGERARTLTRASRIGDIDRKRRAQQEITSL